MQDNPALNFDLDPDAIIRRDQGPKYFGLKRTQLDEGIRRGVIPRPFVLIEGGRATGWTGRQIIEHRRRMIAVQQDHSDIHDARSKTEKEKRRRTETPASSP